MRWNVCSSAAWMSGRAITIHIDSSAVRGMCSVTRPPVCLVAQAVHAAARRSEFSGSSTRWNRAAASGWMSSGSAARRYIAFAVGRTPAMNGSALMLAPCAALAAVAAMSTRGGTGWPKMACSDCRPVPIPEEVSAWLRFTWGRSINTHFVVPKDIPGSHWPRRCLEAVGALSVKSRASGLGSRMPVSLRSRTTAGFFPTSTEIAAQSMIGYAQKGIHGGQVAEMSKGAVGAPFARTWLAPGPVLPPGCGTGRRAMSEVPAIGRATARGIASRQCAVCRQPVYDREDFSCAGDLS